MKQPKITSEKSVSGLQREVICVPGVGSAFGVTRALLVFFYSGNYKQSEEI